MPVTSFLPELEVRLVEAAIIQLQDQLTTRAFPRLICFPDINVLVGHGVVAQAAVARRDCLFDGCDWRTVAASDLL